MRNRASIAAVVCIVALSAVWALAADVVVFGPRNYVRGNGLPVTETATFSVTQPSNPYTLRIDNHGVTDAFVRLNGALIVSTDDFDSGRATRIDRPVNLLAGVNTLAVEVRGKANKSFTLQIFRPNVDTVPPVITASSSPLPNAGGWNNTPVTVTFSCSDAGSGIATCPPPVLISTEGANQTVSGTAVDKAGNQATATVTLKIDTTPPVATAAASPLANANGWNNGPVTTHFTCSDSLSGVTTCPADQTATADGTNLSVTGTARDAAGNTASATSRLFNIDRTPPSISASLSAQVGDGGYYTSPVLARFTCGDTGSGVASCPADQLTSTEGANQAVSATVLDLAGNSASVTSARFSIDLSPPAVSVALTPAPNANAWNNTPVTAHFVCSDAGSGIATCPADQTIAAEGAGQLVTGTVVDRAGHTSTASATVNIDLTPPTLTITSPADGATLFAATALVAGGMSDALSGAGDATCNGAAAATSGGSINCSVTLATGPNAVSVAAHDRAGNTATSTLAVTYSRVPAITITSPQNLSYLSITPTTVTGTVDDDGITTVTINSIPTPVSGRMFSVALPLAEGPNVVTASATATGGAIGTASIEITLDTTPPHVTITSPPDQFVTTADSISVAGNVNDLVVGTVNDLQAQVAVNGSPAQVANRLFLTPSVALALGPNTIEAIATDRVGNAATTQVTVIRQAPTLQPQVHLLSGNNQSAAIGALLAAPLVVTVTDAAGTPAPNQPVVFKVTQNDGLLAGGAAAAATVVVPTDTAGHASALWTLGHRAGAGGNVVEAYSVGAEGTAIFTATGTQGAAGKIVVDTGNDQTGAVNQPLPKPFIAVVVDQGDNRLAGVPVTFTASQGGGSFSGNPTTTVETDSDGRAAAMLTLGLQEGNANNLVLATFDGNTGFPAAFSASGRVPGNPSQTTMSGVVLDNTDHPIPGVIVRAVLTNELHSNATVVQSAVTAQTDAQGQFSIVGAPVGLVKLLVDGSTAQLPGTYPSLEYDLVTVAGQVNTVGQPIYLLPLALDDEHQKCVTATTGGGVLTIPDAPGFSLTFGPGQVTFPGGSKTGCVSVTVVHSDKVPMVPGFGQQPRFIVTIQPSGAVFNPPAAITLPNVDGLTPRAVTEMYSFDHDIGSFVAIGTGVVTDDGLLIRSSPGVGVLKAGWHCGGNPNTAGNVAACGDCKRCDGTNCVVDDSARPSENCKECKNGTVVEKEVGSWKDDVTVGASAKLPDVVKSTVENAINRIPGVHATIEDVTLGVHRRVKDCCDPGNGQTVTNGETESTVSVDAKIPGLDVQIWPLPPTMIDKTWSVTAFGQIGEVRILFLAGVFIRSEISFGAEGGLRTDACGSENCAFGSLTAGASIGLVGEISAQGCFDSTFTSPVCSPTLDISIAPLTLGIEGKVGYNLVSCTSGLDGYVKVLGLKASIEVKLPLLPTLSAEYEIFGGFCAFGTCPS